MRTVEPARGRRAWLRTSPSRARRGVAGVLAGIVVQAALAAGLAANAGAQQWVASWGSSLQGPAPEEWTISNASIRLIARSTIAGDRVRVRLENTFGEQPLSIGAAAVGLRNNGPTLVIGSSRVLQFGGAAAVTVPAGEYVVSDPVDLAVQAEQELAVSLYIPGADVRSSI
ncbi:MAG: SGNH/GDSL hydrolase family protein, partial [Acidobacteria bacterium]|nr:SGNH/GDSL hydrolase family protein [Acidobacteriota bacterium]